MFIKFMAYENPHRGACAARPLHRRQPSADSIPQPTANSLQIDADTVRVNVTVTDVSGHLAPNLQKKNILLFEDNERRATLLQINDAAV